MPDPLGSFDSSDFQPRGQDGAGTAGLIWTQIVAEGVTWLCCAAIALILALILYRRRNFPYRQQSWLVLAFILACGLTHFVDILAFQSPLQRLGALFKVLTALVGLLTVGALLVVMPGAMSVAVAGRLDEERQSFVIERERAESEVRRLNRELERRVAELDSLFNVLPVGIGIASDPQCRDIRVNPAFARILGVASNANASKTAPPGVAPTNFQVLHKGRELSAEELPMQVAAREGVDVVDFEQQVIRDDGAKIDLLGYAKPLFDENGRLRGSVGAFADITERVRAEAARRELEARAVETQKLESLGVLAGGIAHDFNNLLVAVRANAELALQQLPADSEARGFVADIDVAAQRAAELTRQMLAYSGKGRFVLVPLDVRRLVEDMSSLLRPAISKKATLRIECIETLPPIRADVGQISQVVMNLITNASESLGDASGTITLRLDSAKVTAETLAAFPLSADLPPGRYVRLRLVDTGCGMPPEILARIFEPFFSTKFTGRGLGLAAVLGIVRGHRGAIRVASVVGKGTTFTLLFPVMEPAAIPLSKVAAASGDPAPRAGSTLTVMAVDDEPTVRDIILRTLSGAGYRTVTACDGVEAVEMFERRGDEIDLVILDLAMPRMNGQETLRELRRLRPGVLVLLISGYSEQDAIGQFSENPHAAFIQKPFGAMELIDRVGALLPRPASLPPDSASAG